MKQQEAFDHYRYVLFAGEEEEKEEGKVLMICRFCHVRDQLHQAYIQSLFLPSFSFPLSCKIPFLVGCFSSNVMSYP